MKRTLPVYEFMRLSEPVQKAMSRWWFNNNVGETIFPKFAQSDFVSYLSDTVGKNGEISMISPKLINGDFYVNVYFILEDGGKELVRSYQCDDAEGYFDALLDACVQATYTELYGL